MLYVSTLHARELVVSLWGRAWVSRRAEGVLIVGVVSVICCFGELGSDVTPGRKSPCR